MYLDGSRVGRLDNLGEDPLLVHLQGHDGLVCLDVADHVPRGHLLPFVLKREYVIRFFVNQIST